MNNRFISLLSSLVILLLLLSGCRTIVGGIVFGDWGGERKYGAGDEYPAYNISWHDTQDFIAALHKHLADTGQDTVLVRLPTDAEWEYACRAGTTTEYFWGDDWSDAPKYACYEKSRSGDSISMPTETMPVGRKLPNAFGLYDMIGNVSEWCQDRFGSFTEAPLTDPTGAEEGEERVVRGGGFGYGYVNLPVPNSTSRLKLPPELRFPFLGFRLAASINTIEDTGESGMPPEEITLLLPGDVPLTLLQMQSGTFLMGKGKLPSYKNAAASGYGLAGMPEHEVTITKDFYMGMYEVTQQQWLAVMGSWPGEAPKGKKDE